MAERMAYELPFGPHGPFDDDERAMVRALVEAVEASGTHTPLLEVVRQQIGRLESLGEVIDSLPSLFETQKLGSRRRDLDTLVETLAKSDLSNFDMFVPTKALLGRDMIMAEVHFYRLLRLICAETLEGNLLAMHRQAVDQALCTCLYARLAEEVLKHIASDRTVDKAIRARAVTSLAPIWERNTYRIQDVFPVLRATWDARRQVPSTLGTLMGTAEMFGLMMRGADPAFVDYLARPDHTKDEADAFREFLFGAHTEQLRKLEARMHESGVSCVSRSETGVREVVRDACPSQVRDPASAMFEFFLYRHLQAGARRLAKLPGPKRTAEEFVMLHYLATQEAREEEERQEQRAAAG